MKYFDPDFWRMTAGFVIIVLVGLVLVYALSCYNTGCFVR